MDIHKDAFSSGQISSKLWLCEELEKLNHTSKLTWIYGGWYSVTAFLLFSRGKYDVENISSFDLDQSVEEPSRLLNENWVCNGARFQSFTCDCNYIMPVIADCIINTSTEHFENTQWFDNIPKGTLVALQGNDMNHDDHVSKFTSLENYITHFPLSETIYKGELEFKYPDWGFTRYMLIGRK